MKRLLFLIFSAFILFSQNSVMADMAIINKDTARWSFQDKLITTEDGWKNRERQKISDYNEDIYAIEFMDSQNGLAMTNIGIYRTSDGGKTWKLEEGSNNKDLKYLQFIDEKCGWAMDGRGSIILITKDGGFNWEESSLTDLKNIDEVTDFYFTDSKNGWFTGFYNYPNITSLCSFIYHTEDGGVNWERQYKLDGISLYSIYFTDEKYGWAAGEKGTVIHTKDGGLTWEKETAGTYGLSDVYFIDKDKGWTVGNNGIVLYTSDGGHLWKEKDILPFRYTGAVCVYFLDINTGWIEAWTMGEHYIIHTEDGGNNWHEAVKIPYSENN